MNIEIREMNSNDLEEIKHYLQDKFDNFWTYNILKEELEADNSHFIVAMDNDDIIGCFVCRQHSGLRRGGRGQWRKGNDSPRLDSEHKPYGYICSHSEGIF